MALAFDAAFPKARLALLLKLQLSRRRGRRRAAAHHLGLARSCFRQGRQMRGLHSKKNHGVSAL